MIQFQSSVFINLYNLAFCDKNTVTGEIDGVIVSNNDDSEKVLATVVSAIYLFTRDFPSAWIYATGSTESRTRLYHMWVNRYFNIVDADFYIMGKIEDEWEAYVKGKNYHAFAILRKSI